MIYVEPSVDSMQTIERTLYMMISSCLDVSLKETIDISHRFFDFFLPKGVKKLGWPKGTYVEIKYRVVHDSITRIRHLYDIVRPEKLVLVVLNDDNKRLDLLSTVLPIGRDIDVMSYQQLKTKIEDLQPKRKDNKKLDLIKKEVTYQEIQDASVFEKAKYALKNNKVSVFLGAGVSASAGVATWDYLLEQLCVKKGLAKIDSDIDSVVKGRYIIEEYKNSHKEIPDDFYKDIRDILYANTKSSNLISSIASLITQGNIESVISYNYDNLVEREVREIGKSCSPIFNTVRPVEQNSLYIYHVHGYVSHQEEEEGGEYSPIVLGEQEYHKIFQESYNWGNVEQLHALCRTTCFFIGLSMKDPNLRRLIDISIEGSEVEPMHYAFLRRIEYNVPFMEKIMRGFGINCIWYDKYEELPNIINNLMLE